MRSGYTYQIQVDDKDVVKAIVTRDPGSTDYDGYLGQEIDKALIKPGDRIELIRLRS